MTLWKCGAGLGLVFVAGAVMGCSQPADAQSSPAPGATEGAPYVLAGTQVWTVPDPVSGRDYQVFVSLPASYQANPQRRYPVLYATDADYAFPIIRQIARRVNLDGPVIEEFILVGLSYSGGDSGTVSRNRDYTPTPNGPSRASSTPHGGGPAYQAYLKTQALPFVENRFRADPARRVFLGHSYGGLLGAQILFTDPGLFQAYNIRQPVLLVRQAPHHGDGGELRPHPPRPARRRLHVYRRLGGSQTRPPQHLWRGYGGRRSRNGAHAAIAQLSASDRPIRRPAGRGPSDRRSGRVHARAHGGAAGPSLTSG